VLNPKQCGGVGVGVVRLPEFTDETYYDFCSALDKLRAQFPIGKVCRLEALVVDLRGNRGGPLVPALDIAAMFLSKGTVLTQMRDGERVEKHCSTNCRPDLNTTLLLLTDGRTASASEILVEALCDNQRASSMGWPTVGKNVAQVRTAFRI
jgi:carboxyl-terminal processing protease